MRIVAGGTGLIGKRLIAHWLKQNHAITVIGRTTEHIVEVFGDRVKAVTWSQLSPELFQSAEVVVNLAGASIGDKKWSESRKEEIFKSRIDTTKKLAEILATLGPQSPPLFNASAIGIYGLQQQSTDGLPAKLDEDSVIAWDKPLDFLSAIGTRWEKAAEPAIKKGVRVVFLRFGLVLAKEGGVLPRLAKPFKFFVGGPMGTGNQAFTWVAIDDLIRAIDFLLSRKDLFGAFNVTAPQAVQQKMLAKTMGKILKRPAIMPMPAFVLKKILGEDMARELILEGQNIYPKRLLQQNFEFKYPDIESALKLHLL